MTALENLPPTIGVEEAGELLGLCRTSAYEAVKRGEIPTIRLNGRLHVPVARLRSLLGLTGPSTAEPPDDLPPAEQGTDHEGLHREAVHSLSTTGPLQGG